MNTRLLRAVLPVGILILGPVPGWAGASEGRPVQALGSAAPLGYDSDKVKGFHVILASVPARPQSLSDSPGEEPLGKGVFGVISGGVHPFEIGGGATVLLRATPARRPEIRELLAPSEEGRLWLVFEDVRLKALSPGVLSYEVYLNLPQTAITGDAALGLDHFVGNISLYELTGAEAKSPAAPGLTVRLPILPGHGAGALRSALAPDSHGPVEVFISLLPQMAPGATPSRAAVLRIGKIRLETSEP